MIKTPDTISNPKSDTVEGFPIVSAIIMMLLMLLFFASIIYVLVSSLS